MLLHILDKGIYVVAYIIRRLYVVAYIMFVRLITSDVILKYIKGDEANHLRFQLHNRN